MENNSKWYIKEIGGDKYVYHCFSFKPEIQEHSFIGNEFIGMDPSETTDHQNIMDRVIEAGKEGFLPNLLGELKDVIGENNYEYDGYEISEEEYSHYFLIKASIYKAVMSKIKLWREFKEFNELMYWDEKEVLE